MEGGEERGCTDRGEAVVAIPTPSPPQQVAPCHQRLPRRSRAAAGGGHRHSHQQSVVGNGLVASLACITYPPTTTPTWPPDASNS